MRIPLPAIVLAIVLTAPAGSGWAQLPASDSRLAVELDFSGVDRFWEIYSELSKGREPERSRWDALFATPGYALLEERERRRSMLTDAFRRAFLPGVADTAQPPSDWVGHVLPHLEQLPDARAELERFRAELQHAPFLEQALARAQTILPAGVTERHRPPPISFIFFAPDGRGYSRLLLDLLYLMRMEDPTDFLAHELFHAYRNHVARPLARPFGDDLLVWTLNNAENEGIADRLDKSAVPHLNDAEMAARFANPRRRTYYELYRREYHRAEHWLRYTEDVLERAAAEPERAAELGSDLHRTLPDNGRVLGAWMAATIEERLGRDTLIGVVGDTFGFWRAYNEAARQSEGGAYVLSDAAMDAIEQLEHRYAGELP